MMHENHYDYDPFLRRWVFWSIWLNGRAAVVKQYVDKYQVWRPIQQRPRDGTE